MAKLQENTKKAQELLQQKKETLSNKKQEIAVAKGRKTDAEKIIEEKEKEVTKLGYDPKSIQSTMADIAEAIKKENSVLEDIIEELSAEEI